MNFNKSSFRIDKTDFLKGNNSYTNYPDGGVTTDTIGMNIWSKPGMIAAVPAIGASKNASLPSEDLVGWGIGKSGNGLKAMAVMTDSSDDGYFYSVGETNGTFTQAGTEDTSNNYRGGITDVSFYQSYFFTTSTSNIVRHTADLAGEDLSYWVSTLGQPSLNGFVPHPTVVYGDIMYIADGSYLHSLDGTTPSQQVLFLGTEWVVTAMTVYNNLIYIAATPYLDNGGQRHTGSKIFTWNGYSASWLDEWNVDYRVDTMYVDRTGIMYIFNSHYMGYWTGSRVQFLRKVEKQIFKHQVASITNSLIYADNDKIIRYGTPIFGGTKRFTIPYLSNAGEINGDFLGVNSIYNNSLMIIEKPSGATNISNPRVSDMDTVSDFSTTSSGEFTFNKRRFSKPIKIKGLSIDTTQVTTLGQSYIIKYINDRNETITLATFEYATTEHRQKYTWVFDKVAAQRATRSVQPILEIVGGGHVEGLDFFYGTAEAKFNQ